MKIKRVLARARVKIRSRQEQKEANKIARLTIQTNKYLNQAKAASLLAAAQEKRRQAEIKKATALSKVEKRNLLSNPTARSIIGTIRKAYKANVKPAPKKKAKRKSAKK